MTKKEFYDYIGETYAHNFERYTDMFGFDQLLQLLQDVKNKTILDYGCGPGNFSETLAKKGAIVTGTDISDKMLKLAKEKSHKNLTFKTIENALKTNYDLCVSTFVLPCIANQEEMYNIFFNINQRLNPLGKLLILAPHPLGIGHQYFSFSMTGPENPYDGCDIKYALKGIKEKFNDTWWSNQKVMDILHESNFSRIKTHEPIPSEDSKWIDERIQAPFVIFEAWK